MAADVAVAWGNDNAVGFTVKGGNHESWKKGIGMRIDEVDPDDFAAELANAKQGNHGMFMDWLTDRDLHHDEAANRTAINAAKTSHQEPPIVYHKHAESGKVIASLVAPVPTPARLSKDPLLDFASHGDGWTTEPVPHAPRPKAVVSKAEREAQKGGGPNEFRRRHYAGKIVTKDAAGQDSTPPREKIGALGVNDTPPPRPFGLPKRLASHLSEIRSWLPKGLHGLIRKLHGATATNAETEALGTTLREAADSQWDKFRGSDEWTSHLHRLHDHNATKPVLDALERLGSGAGKATSADHLLTIHTALGEIGDREAAEAAKRGTGTKKQQTAAALRANQHAQHAAAIKDALTAVSTSDASRLRDLHANYNWSRMATGVKLDKQVHGMLEDKRVGQWLEKKLAAEGKKRGSPIKVLANPSLIPVGHGEAPGSKGFVDPHTELRDEPRRRALLYRYRDDPSLVKALRNQVTWDADRHPSYKTDVDDHIKRSIERYIMRLEDAEADKGASGTKVAPARRRLVNQQVHARYARERLADVRGMLQKLRTP